MGDFWNVKEVEAIVADYFKMLDNELHGIHYNKTEHRHALSTLLNTRTDGSIERKHQNISAVLIDQGFPYIAGYKPLQNYQQLLLLLTDDIIIWSVKACHTLAVWLLLRVVQPYHHQ